MGSHMSPLSAFISSGRALMASGRMPNALRNFPFKTLFANHPPTNATALPGVEMLERSFLEKVWNQRFDQTLVSTFRRSFCFTPISMRHVSTCQLPPLARTAATVKDVSLSAHNLMKVEAGAFSKVGGARMKLEARGFSRPFMKLEAGAFPKAGGARTKLEAGAFSRAGGARRFAYTDSKGVAHFRARGFRGAYQDPNRRRNLMVVVGIAGGALSVFYVTHLEEVPYTHRKHFVAISPATERALGEQQFLEIKAQFKPDILPNNHPVTRRVHKVVSQIIDAAYPGVGVPPANKRNTDGELILDAAPTPEKEVAKHWGKQPVPIPGEGHTHDAVDDVMKSQRHAEELRGVDREMMNEGVHGAPDQGGGGGYTTHLQGLQWEVIVVNKDILNAFCLPGGKIVVFTGLIKQFPTTEELATVLGHEVGHAVARHHGEKVSSGVALSILELVVYAAGVPIEIVVPATQSLLTLPNSRKLESEADKIGLMLMAAGGFDPRVAPGFYAKMAELEGTPEYFQYLSTHPAGQQRARALAQAKVMQEAVQVYERTIESRAQPKGFSWAF